MIFPRGRKALQRYGRNKVIAILVTFAVLWIYLKVFAPRGLLLSRLDWEPRVVTPGKAWDERWSNVVVGADGVVEAVFSDSVLASAGGAAALVLRRTKVRTVEGHPVIVLHDAGAVGPGRPDVGDSVSVKGMYDWSTGGGVVRAVRSDSSAFGLERR
jgi:subtilisin family serine protease